MHSQYTPEQIARFWSKVDKNGPVPAHRPDLGPCWVWTRARDTNGYGNVRINKKYRRASRVAYTLTFGDMPRHVFACHHCDNPPCCNPSHMFPGTSADNMRDCVEKGRLNNHWRHHPERRMFGEDVPSARLTEDAVRDIRRRLASGVSRAQLAGEYGVSRSTVRKVAVGETWTHIHC